MAIDLKFPHEADPDLVAEEYEPGAVEEAAKNGLTFEKLGPRKFRVHGTKLGQSVDLVTTIGKSTVAVTGDASFLARGTVVGRLERDMPALLRRCEKTTTARSGGSGSKGKA